MKGGRQEIRERGDSGKECCRKGGRHEREMQESRDVGKEIPLRERREDEILHPPHQ